MVGHIMLLEKLSRCLEKVLLLKPYSEEHILLQDFMNTGIASALDEYLLTVLPEVKWLDSMYYGEEKLQFFHMYSCDEQTRNLRDFLAKELMFSTTGYMGDIIDALRKVCKGLDSELNFVFTNQPLTFNGVQVTIQGDFEKLITEAASKLYDKYIGTESGDKSPQFDLNTFTKSIVDLPIKFFAGITIFKNQKILELRHDIAHSEISYFFSLMVINRTMLNAGEWIMYQFAIPSFGKHEIGRFSCATDIIMTENEVSAIKCLVNYVLTPFTQHIENIKSVKASTKSAIGSIMSRNGSHNIGSHVLAALSHHVGTMPDDRVLYQYIQHRMDYIANVTTDFPVWTQPTMFLGELMREFLSQRHLLEHIAESEGLSAWEFQNPNLVGAAAKSQHGKIKIRIRRKDQQGTFKDVVDYSADGGGVELPQDVALAIPGGVVGNHAFYTILENVIRNAAKHGWSAKPIEEKKNANLEITIDYTDKYTEKEGGLVEFKVWDNMSNADSIDKETGKSLLERQKGRMGQKLIEDDGRLRRENWGMAEIKISAGYLMSRGVNEIGGLSESGDTIVEPCQVKDGAVQRLGYRFSIRKPKDVIFVLGDNQKKFLTTIGGERLKSLANQGIEFVEFTEVRCSKERNRFAARHVVMPQFGNEEKSRGDLPFRVLVWKGGVNECDKLVAELDPSNIQESLQKPDADLAENLRIAVETAWLGLLRNQAGGAGEDKGLYKRLEKGLALVVNTVGSDSHAGLGLITDDDLLEFVFKNGLRTAIETYLESHGTKVPEELCDVLWVLHAIYPENWSFGKHPGVEIRAKIAWSLLSRLQMVEKVLLSSQSIAALNASRSRLHLDECEGPLAERIVNALDRAEDYLKYRYGPPPRKGSPSGKEDRETVFKRRDYWTKNPHPIADFILHLRGVFKETDVFLRKYEERIATLPAGFSSSNVADGKPAFASSGLFGFVDILPRKPEKGCEKAVANYTRHDRPGVSLPEGVIYHEPLSGTQSYLNSLVRLSREGLEKMAGADVILEKLTENALLKVCIADERMAKFLRDHQTVRDTYNAEKILVLDDKWIERCMDLDQDPEIVAEASAESEKAATKTYKKDFEVGLHTPRMDVLRSIRDFVRGLENVPATSSDRAWVQDNITDYTSPQLPEGEKDYGFWEKGKEFDILVLHQGLIDKWLGESAHSEAHIAVFLELLKRYVKYVVITTGRGTPANIPPGARVLPFPTLESTLFKMYPEKMVLVDTILNVLPVHGAELKGENS